MRRFAPLINTPKNFGASRQVNNRYFCIQPIFRILYFALLINMPKVFGASRRVNNKNINYQYWVENIGCQFSGGGGINCTGLPSYQHWGKNMSCQYWAENIGCQYSGEYKLYWVKKKVKEKNLWRQILLKKLKEKFSLDF